MATLATLPFLRNLFDGYLSDDWILAAYAAHSTQSFFSLFHTNNLGGISGGAYRPLFALFWEIGHFFGGTPFPLHLIQLLFHISTALLIVWIGREICGNEYKKVGIVAALFFVVFPNHAEAVIWLATSADPIGTFFYFLALACYLHARQQEKNVLLWLVGALVAALLAFFSKEMMVTLPAVLLLWECLRLKKTQLKKDLGRALLFLSPFFLLCAAYLFLRWQATGLVFGYYAAPKLSIDPTVAIRSIVTMTLSHFFSGDLRTYWSPTLNYQNILAALIAVTGTVALIMRRWIRPSRTLVFLVGAYILSLGPVVQFGINTVPGRVTDEGERYVYLPSVFFALLLGWIVVSLRDRFSAAGRKMFAATIVLFCVFLTTQLVIKTERWHQAAKMAAHILTTWHEQYTSAPADGVITVGLPDNTRGIYLWRNGFAEAIAAQFGIHPDMIVTPIRTVTDSENAFSLTSLPKRYLYQAAQGNDIVGDPIFEGGDYTSTLLDPIDARYPLSYRYFSREATLRFSQAFLQTNAGRTIAVMAWDGKGWQRVDVRP
ncbi:glycosyltransferase family 39 protein [Patescibacteria group bacterium]|nr:glycosyltransferase family 39 protein [Patescibacteria group bacterium]